MSIDFNEYGYKKVAPGDYFSFTCSRCGDCCRNVKDSVMVERLDLYRLTRFLGMGISEVVLQYTDTTFLAWDFPVLTLKTKPHMGACIFLKSSKCRVHGGAKPRACRTYPIGVGPDDVHPGEWLSFIVSKKPHHFTGPRRLVGDWIDETFTTEDRAFVAADYAYTGELAEITRNIDKQYEHEVLSLMIYFKYMNYDLSADFMPQYNRNMEELKCHLRRFGRRAYSA